MYSPLNEKRRPDSSGLPRTCVLISIILLFAVGITLAVLSATLWRTTPPGHDWAQYNYNLRNDRYATRAELSPARVHDLALECEFLFTRAANETARFNAQPIVAGDTLYFSGNGGLIKAVHAGHGHCDELWTFTVRTLFEGMGAEAHSPPDAQHGEPVDVELESEIVQSRVTPAYYTDAQGRGKLVALAPGFPLAANFADWFRLPMVMFQLDAANGTIDWVTNLTAPGRDNIEEVLMSTFSAPTVHNGVAYTGLSSAVNVFDAATLQSPAFLNTTADPYRSLGLFIAVEVEHGDLLWKRPTIPRKPAGYEGRWFSGGGIWGSGPSILERADAAPLVFYGTGQYYSVPAEVEACLNAPEAVPTVGTTRRGETGGGLLACYAAAVDLLPSLGVHAAHGNASGLPLAGNAVTALDAATGEPVWTTPATGLDTWAVPCGLNPTNDQPGCPVATPGPDWDAASGHQPALLPYKGTFRLVTHTKGGLILIMDLDTGEILEKWDVCHGSAEGGIHFGFSYDPLTDMLMVPCAAGLRITDLGALAATDIVTVRTLADGSQICHSGVLNGISMSTGLLVWQAVPPGAHAVGDFAACSGPNVNRIDTRFKYGIGATFDYKTHVNPSTVVHRYESETPYPVDTDYDASIHTPGLVANGMVFWGASGGKLFATDVATGALVREFSCPAGGGGFFGAGPLVTDTRLIFGCGDGTQNGNVVRVYDLPATSP